MEPDDTYLKPTGEIFMSLESDFKDKFDQLFFDIGENIDSSRARDLCFIRLQEAKFWLNKAITKID